ncbi:MAG: acyl-CoA dehydrogenase family protein [Proteobacteria bacterium]|nr:acyl-CoA dehydrogenase family protein [Pseudomonadota bacterium]
MDFNLSPEHEELRLKVRKFIDEHVLPLEKDPANFSEYENIPHARLEPVREKARALGLWAPQSPKEYGGMELPMVAWAAIYEEAARSIFGPLAINCMAPDDGNMNMLRLVGTKEQKDKWLAPIVAGKVRSAFAMTEPAPGGGSDPTMIRTRAEKKGGKYVVHGRKWFITGADGASHFILMARTSDDARKGLTAFLFHKDQPGWRIVRRIEIMGPEEHGGHCELEFDGLEIPEENILLGEGEGLRLMQVRLGPARLTHCMRWTGFAKRCVEIAQEYVARREGFGIKLADRESVQIKLGEVAQQIQIARLLTMHAAWMLDQGGRARKEVSMAKVHVANALHQAADVAIQLQGARGFSKDTIVEWLYRYARSAKLVDGASEVHMMVLAKFMRQEGQDFWQWGPGEGRRNARS